MRHARRKYRTFSFKCFFCNIASLFATTATSTVSQTQTDTRHSHSLGQSDARKVERKKEGRKWKEKDWRRTSEWHHLSIVRGESLCPSPSSERRGPGATDCRARALSCGRMDADGPLASDNSADYITIRKPEIRRRRPRCLEERRAAAIAEYVDIMGEKKDIILRLVSWQWPWTKSER